MSWYRDNDGKIITDEEFQSDCTECSCFCQEGTISIPCDGERTDCPYFKEVDASEYDKEIRNKAIDEFAKRLKSDEFQKYNLDFVFETSRDLSYSQCINAFEEYIDEIAEEMKGGGENETNRR